MAVITTRSVGLEMDDEEYEFAEVDVPNEVAWQVADHIKEVLVSLLEATIVNKTEQGWELYCEYVRGLKREAWFYVNVEITDSLDQSPHMMFTFVENFLVREQLHRKFDAVDHSELQKSLDYLQKLRAMIPRGGAV